MAKIAELTNQASWDEWVSTRPPVVLDLCKRYPPDRLYLMKSTGHRVTILAYNENGTVRVDISGQWNCLIFEREVFGIDPNDLEECEIPNETEITGVAITEEENVKVFCKILHDDMENNNATLRN